MTKQEALDYYGCSVQALADALGVTSEAVYQWVAVPPLRQMQLQSITRGRLKADLSVSKPQKTG